MVYAESKGVRSRLASTRRWTNWISSARSWSTWRSAGCRKRADARRLTRACIPPRHAASHRPRAIMTRRSISDDLVRDLAFTLKKGTCRGRKRVFRVVCNQIRLRSPHEKHDCVDYRRITEMHLSLFTRKSQRRQKPIGSSAKQSWVFLTR